MKRDHYSDIDNIAHLCGDDAVTIWNKLREDDRFAKWSGSDNPSKHHYGNGELLRHTAEIIRLGIATQDQLNFDMDMTEWFFSALFHDVGKMYDYAPGPNTDGQWIPTTHKRLIHHISRSAVYWSNLVNQYPEIAEQYHDNVLHAILAHHGQREWGSPVAPKTRIAWLLHLCDSLSARMDDCDKIDYLSLRK